MAEAPDPGRISSRLRSKVKSAATAQEIARTTVKTTRLSTLEQDSWEEPADVTLETYVDDDDEIVQTGGKRTYSSRKRKRGKRAATGEVNVHKFRSFEQILHDEGYANAPRGIPTYITAAAAPSTKPGRHFCSVCGYFAGYTCTRCGMRFCCIPCDIKHKETRCLKFTM